VTYLLKAKILEPEKEPLLCNGCVTCNKRVTIEAVFYVTSVPRLHNGDQLPLRESLEAVVRRVGFWCEMAASLRRRESESRGTSTVGRRY
jgi:hypothetical protein